ncbi:MAG: RsmD family RNA methyltransferase [Planctomycetota bacterium]|nr:RsmD family RNA methyltransferase [Planctomycetota bacterium]
MRIIAGSARRVQLEVAAESTARPFLEMARGALFNSLATRIGDAAVLDLYAGSGALGLEALSRGAASCVFVERDPAAVAVLKKNAVRCGLAAGCRIAGSDVRAFLAGETGKNALYTLIFVDPPFPELAEWTRDGAAGDVMRDAARLLAPDGLLVFRLEEGKVPPPGWPGLELSDERRYGRSRICRYVAAHGKD